MSTTFWDRLWRSAGLPPEGFLRGAHTRSSAGAAVVATADVTASLPLPRGLAACHLRDDHRSKMTAANMIAGMANPSRHHQMWG